MSTSHEPFQTIIKKNFKKRSVYMENDILFIMNNDTMNIIKKEVIVGCSINNNLFIHLKNSPPIEISLLGYDHSFGVEIISFIYTLMESSERKDHDYYS